MSHIVSEVPEAFIAAADSWRFCRNYSHKQALLQKSDSIPNALPPDRLGDGQQRLHLPI